MAANKQNLLSSRRRLARIRCLKECIECFRTSKELPESLCYIPKSKEYRTTKATKIIAYAEANKQSATVAELECVANHRILVSDEEFCNSQGQWGRFIKVTVLFTKNFTNDTLTKVG